MIKYSQLFLIGGKEEKIKHPGLLKDFLHFTLPDSRIPLITGAQVRDKKAEIENMFQTEH